MKKKTKIFIFNPYPAIGGVDTTIKKFIFSLPNNCQVEYLSLRKTENFRKNNIKNTVVNSNSTFKSFFQIYKIFKNDKHKNKIFFSVQYFVNVWSIIFIKLFLKKKLFIYEVNHLDELRFYSNFKDFIKKNIIKVLVKILYRYSDIIAANSQELSEDLEKYTGRKIHTLYNPCFEKVKIKKKRYKPKNVINILNISRFEDQKDHYTLLKAINISEIKNQINLTLVGYGTNYNKIKNFLSKNKIKAKIVLNEKKLNKFYRKADLYVCSSLYEGLPTTVIEAASNSLPIICSDFKSGSKEILKNGKAGYLFSVGNFKLLSKLLSKFYYNPKPFYKKEIKCRKNLNRFHVKRNINLFKSLIKELF
ncbi:glycosyltransferase [Candidatus Pelagibacter sp.]|nr:glycosyltransferase [Candidatus Pelagibacter sp.]